MRSLLQNVESQGTVDYQLGGHECTRPPAVQQGRAQDHFEIKPAESNPLVWRPQVIQSKNLKGTNIASHFMFSVLDKSPLILVSQLVFNIYWTRFGF